MSKRKAVSLFLAGAFLPVLLAAPFFFFAEPLQKTNAQTVDDFLTLDPSLSDAIQSAEDIDAAIAALADELTKQIVSDLLSQALGTAVFKEAVRQLEGGVLEASYEEIFRTVLDNPAVADVLSGAGEVLSDAEKLLVIDEAIASLGLDPAVEAVVGGAFGDILDQDIVTQTVNLLLNDPSVESAMAALFSNVGPSVVEAVEQFVSLDPTIQALLADSSKTFEQVQSAVESVIEGNLDEIADIIGGQIIDEISKSGDIGAVLNTVFNQSTAVVLTDVLSGDFKSVLGGVLTSTLDPILEDTLLASLDSMLGTSVSGILEGSLDIDGLFGSVIGTVVDGGSFETIISDAFGGVLQNLAPVIAGNLDLSSILGGTFDLDTLDTLLGGALDLNTLNGILSGTLDLDDFLGGVLDAGTIESLLSGTIDIQTIAGDIIQIDVNVLETLLGGELDLDAFDSILSGTIDLDKAADLLGVDAGTIGQLLSGNLDVNTLVDGVLNLDTLNDLLGGTLDFDTLNDILGGVLDSGDLAALEGIIDLEALGANIIDLDTLSTILGGDFSLETLDTILSGTLDLDNFLGGVLDAGTVESLLSGTIDIQTIAGDILQIDLDTLNSFLGGALDLDAFDSILAGTIDLDKLLTSCFVPGCEAALDFGTLSDLLSGTIDLDSLVDGVLNLDSLDSLLSGTLDLGTLDSILGGSLDLNTITDLLGGSLDFNTFLGDTLGNILGGFDASQLANLTDAAFTTLEKEIAERLVGGLTNLISALLFGPGVFGGKVTEVVEECDCKGGLVVNVGPPRPVQRLWTGKGKSYEYKYEDPEVGDWVLGKHDNIPFVCWKKTKFGCKPVDYLTGADLIGSSKEDATPEACFETPGGWVEPVSGKTFLSQGACESEQEDSGGCSNFDAEGNCIE